MVFEREKSLMEISIMGTLPGLTEKMTEVADLPALDSGLGLSNLHERIWTFFELSIESARLGNSPSGSPGRKASGREWIASWTSLGARGKRSQGVSHQERKVELDGKRCDIWCEGSRGGGRVGDAKSDRTPVIDLGCDGEEDSAVCIPEDASGGVREGSSDQERLKVFSGGEPRSEAPSLSHREWVWLLQSRDRVDDGCDL